MTKARTIAAVGAYAGVGVFGASLGASAGAYVEVGRQAPDEPVAAPIVDGWLDEWTAAPVVLRGRDGPVEVWVRQQPDGLHVAARIPDDNVEAGDRLEVTIEMPAPHTAAAGAELATVATFWLDLQGVRGERGPCTGCRGLGRRADGGLVVEGWVPAGELPDTSLPAIPTGLTVAGVDSDFTFERRHPPVAVPPAPIAFDVTDAPVPNGCVLVSPAAPDAIRVMSGREASYATMPREVAAWGDVVVADGNPCTGVGGLHVLRDGEPTGWIETDGEQVGAIAVAHRRTRLLLVHPAKPAWVRLVDVDRRGDVVADVSGDLADDGDPGTWPRGGALVYDAALERIAWEGEVVDARGNVVPSTIGAEWQDAIGAWVPFGAPVLLPTTPPSVVRDDRAWVRRATATPGRLALAATPIRRRLIFRDGCGSWWGLGIRGSP